MLLLAACSPNGGTDDGQSLLDNEQLPVNYEIEASPSNENHGIPPDAERAGMAYTDPFIGMTVMLKHPDWIWAKGDDRSQVYFFKEHDEVGDNMISISSFEYDEKTEELSIEELTEYLWAQMKESYAAIPDVVISYSNREEITIGGEYRGFAYTTEIVFSDGEIYAFQSLFWHAGGKMYQCTASWNPQAFEEVRNILNGILETFTIID
jgi:hypothetical protein